MGKPRIEIREDMPKGKRAAGSFPSSPSSSSSSSSSDFEFTVSLSPSSRRSAASNLCPADELFYKGQLLPLHLSPRISMVRTLLLASSSISSSSSDTTTTTSTTTTASRDSNGSTSSSTSSISSSSSGIVHAAELLLLLQPAAGCCDDDSSRPSSFTEEEARRAAISSNKKNCKLYFASLANRFSSVFLTRGGSKKDVSSFDVDFQLSTTTTTTTTSTGKRMNSSAAKQVIKKYVKKVKPLYEKLKNQNQNQNQNVQPQKKKTFSFSIIRRESSRESSMKRQEELRGVYSHSHSHSFSGNLRFPRRKRSASSCPSSMRSSPTHSGLLTVGGGTRTPPVSASSSLSSMEELQSAIQGAIAHCKSTMAPQSSQKID